MPMLMIRCPSTGKDVPTGFEADSPFAITFSGVDAHCPHCGQPHEVRMEDLYLASDPRGDSTSPPEGLRPRRRYPAGGGGD